VFVADSKAASNVRIAPTRRTGKTHTAVNFAAVNLSEGGTVLVTSNNPCALRAFVEKLPPQLRKLCLDMASCDEGNMVDVHRALEAMHLELSIVFEQHVEFDRNIEVCRLRLTGHVVVHPGQLATALTIVTSFLLFRLARKPSIARKGPYPTLTRPSVRRDWPGET
jgi:hypothetical protein